MNRKTEWLFARKYLFSRSSHSMINIIAAVSIVAVAVPVAAMVILLSVFNGFEQLVRQNYAAVDADIEIVASGAEGERWLQATDANRQTFAACEGVEAVSFIIDRQALLERGERQTTARVRGADSYYGEVVPIARHILLGEWATEHGEENRIVVGEGVAYSLGIFSTVGEGVSLYSFGGGRVGSLFPAGGVRSEQIPIGGIFSIDRENDSETVLTSFRAASQLFATGLRADAVLVRIGEGENPSRVRAALAESLGEGVRIITREEKNSLFYRIMRYEKWGVFFVSLLVLIIASLSIAGTVIMLIVEKRGERITLRALGGDGGFIRRIFVREGLLIAGLGGLGGLLIGIVTVLSQQYLHIIKMPAGAFITDSYPVELHLADIAAILITFIAVAWIIAHLATRTMIEKQSLCDTKP